MVQKRHQKKDVEYALKHARDSGLTVEETHNGHLWGRVRCPVCGKVIQVYCTPTNPSEHGKFIRKKVDACLARHGTPTEVEEDEEDGDGDI